MIKEPIIVFTIDDGLMTDYTKAYPIFRKRGLKATSYIVGSFPDGSEASFMPWEYIKKIQQSGWDIQDHSYTHREMSTLSESELEDELSSNNSIYSENEIGSTQHHAYPYGSNNALSKQVFSQHRKTARLIGHTGTTYDEIKANPYLIKACNMDVQDEAGLNAVKNVIDTTAQNQQGVLVLFFHHVKTHEQTSVQEGYLENIVDYVINKGLRVMTMDEMYNYVTES